MTDEEKIEESLRICEEIRKYQAQEATSQPRQVGMGQDTRREIDRILSGETFQRGISSGESLDTPHGDTPHGDIHQGGTGLHEGGGVPQEATPATATPVPNDIPVEVNVSIQDDIVIKNDIPVQDDIFIQDDMLVQDDMPVQDDNVIQDDNVVENDISSKDDVPAQDDMSNQNDISYIPGRELKLESVSDDLNPAGSPGVSDEDGEEYQDKHPMLHTILEVLICAAAALLLSLFITSFVAYHTSVEGSSMDPTLTNGDQLIVEKVSYYFHDPRRFDVVVFPFSEDVNFIKRVIGLPGETVQITNGEIYINGQKLDENYCEELIQEPGLAAEGVHLGEDEFFVLGDNRNASVDSRSDEVGIIKRERIKGKAWIRFYPFDQFSRIE